MPIAYRDRSRRPQRRRTMLGGETMASRPQVVFSPCPIVASRPMPLELSKFTRQLSQTFLRQFPTLVCFQDAPGNRPRYSHEATVRDFSGIDLLVE